MISPTQFARGEDIVVFILVEAEILPYRTGPRGSARFRSQFGKQQHAATNDVDVF